jgi:putative ABC transport system ATP-binding protein
MFELQEVCKSYVRRGHSVTALRASSLTIPRGDYAAIVGPSGSGKSTLLSVLGGMLTPDGGKVLLDSVSIYDLPVAKRTSFRRERIGFVFQTFNLVPYLTALENVQIPLFLAGLPDDEQQVRAETLLERVGLGERLHHKPSELSTGQQQRVALARTLANDPPVILADEPTGNLDPDSRRVVLDFFDQLHAEGQTILVVTHDTFVADRAKRIFHLADGAITEQSESSQLRVA